MSVRPKTQPLLARPGARYACMGDGLCCTDIHAVGPLDRREQATLRAIDPRLVVYRAHTRDHVLVHGADGSCPFLREDGCMIHNQLGPEAKPVACNRFPLRLTATPEGGRIGTAHSCPCRTLGDRPPLSPEHARPSLLDARGRLEAELRVTGPVPMKGRHTLPFGAYVSWESALFARLARAKSLPQALEVAPFGKPRRGSYLATARELVAEPAQNRYEAACHWLGHALLRHLGERPGAWPERPWAPSFARAAQRSAASERARDVYTDWLSDDIWCLHWTVRTTAHGILGELATLLALAQRIARSLQRRGHAPAVAAAESVTIVELARDSEPWQQLRQQLPR